MENQTTPPAAPSPAPGPAPAPQPVGAPPSQTVNNNAQLSPPFVPSVWPGAFGIYKHSKAAILLNIWPIIILYLLNLVLSFLQYIPKYGTVLYYLTIPVTALIYISYIIAQLDGVKGVKIEVEEAIKRSVKYLLNGIGLYLFMGLALFLSFIAFVIPFFFVLPRITLAPYFMIDQNMNFVDAFSASWNHTKGHVGKIYGVIGVNIVFFLLMLTLIGIPFALYFLLMYMAAFAVVYYYILGQNPAQAGAPIPVAGANPPAPTSGNPAPIATAPTTPTAPAEPEAAQTPTTPKDSSDKPPTPPAS